ncbi:MAG: hypothetical protein WCO98_16645 [bacterium]
MKIKTSRTMIIASVLTLGLATAAFAQFGMNGDGPQCRDQHQGPPPPPPAAHAVMDSGTTGVYILEGPKFTKYDSASLEQLGQLELGIPADTPVTAVTGDNTMMPPPPPPVPSNFVIYNGSGSTTEYLLAVAGDTFYKISGDTFAVVVKTPLTTPVKPVVQNDTTTTTDTAVTDTTPATGNDQQLKGRPELGRQQGGEDMDDRQGPPQDRPEMQGPPMPPPAKPKLDLNGDILYILRGNQLTSISVSDGSIKASVVTGTPPAGKKSAPARKSKRIKN